ncbi:MAG: ABC transporter permease, partial [Planctomycetes bacterium]|nr:ABC transporter permease [Planctomycetota bacterium]
GVAGVFQFARVGGDPTAGQGLELQVVAAVVLGGGSLAGGEGSVLGAVLGALCMALLANGCTLEGLPVYVQEILVGAIILFAVALDRCRHRRG